MSRFDDALVFVLKYEGGFVDHPDDPGGATNRGVTQAVYDTWRLENGQVKRSVREITEEEVKTIYRVRYWEVARCDRLPLPLDLVHFDTAVNMGPTANPHPDRQGASELLQNSLGNLKPDGVFGAKSLARLAEVQGRIGLRQVIRNYLSDRLLYYASRGHFATFGKGWFRRVVDLAMEAKT